jgi:BMFP domain-containing protein YqiC
MLKAFADKVFEELQQHLPRDVELLPKHELKLALSSALAKLDLVTRDEFDAQCAVLERTRQRLETLEKALSELESRT